jgi:hypothetical protein
MKRRGPVVVDIVYRLSRLAWLASRCFMRLRILLLRLDICPPSVAPQTLVGSVDAVAVGTCVSSHAHRVAGGSRPPPAPTERSMRIYRTTLFGS